MSGRLGELLLILLIIFVIFGAGKLPQVMGDIGRGIKALKSGMRAEDKDLQHKQHKSLKKRKNK